MKSSIIFCAVIACAFGAIIPFSIPENSVNSDVISITVSSGFIAGENQFPWMVSVRAGSGTNVTTCAGSLIGSHWVLTSASCLLGFGSASFGFGSVNVTKPKHSQYQTSNNFIFHPKYNPSTLANNMALVKLSSVVPLGSNIGIVRLVSKSQSTSNFIGVPATLSGWGNLSTTLRWINQKTITNNECTLMYGPSLITSTILCARGWDSILTNACDGDAGAPLVYNENGIYSQIGLVSFISSRGCKYGDPAGYTRIGSYLPWISAHTGLVIRP